VNLPDRELGVLVRSTLPVGEVVWVLATEKAALSRLVNRDGKTAGGFWPRGRFL
jgi:hypothetical protein